jgi:hypothetical protein
MSFINMRAADPASAGAGKISSARVYRHGDVLPSTKKISGFASDLTLCEAYRGFRWGFGIKPRVQYAAVWTVAGKCTLCVKQREGFL